MRLLSFHLARPYLDLSRFRLVFQLCPPDIRSTATLEETLAPMYENILAIAFMMETA